MAMGISHSFFIPLMLSNNVCWISIVLFVGQGFFFVHISYIFTNYINEKRLHHHSHFYDKETKAQWDNGLMGVGKLGFVPGLWSL